MADIDIPKGIETGRPKTAFIELSQQELLLLMRHHQEHADEMEEIADWLERHEPEIGSGEFRRFILQRRRRAQTLGNLAATLRPIREIGELDEVMR